MTAVTAGDYSQRLHRASSARHRALSELLGVDLFSLTSLMGPINDGPEWPSDAAWLTWVRNGRAGIISDGLSDPFVELNRPAHGLGLEVYLESPDCLPVEGQSPMAISDTWLFPMAAEISHTLAAYQRLCVPLLAGEPVAIRFNIEHIKDGRGLVGALLHTPSNLAQGLDTLTGNIRLTCASLLTVEELRWLVGRKLEGRKKLLNLLEQAGVAGLALSERDSVV